MMTVSRRHLDLSTSDKKNRNSENDEEFDAEFSSKLRIFVAVVVFLSLKICLVQLSNFSTILMNYFSKNMNFETSLSIIPKKKLPFRLSGVIKIRIFLFEN